MKNSNRTDKKSTTGRKKNKPKPGPPIGKKLPGIFDGLIRYGIIIFIAVLLIGNYSTRRASISEADQLAAELSELQREHAGLQKDLERISDPEWRESYWKWRTMRHEPGEYYIDFIEPGVF